MAKQIIRKSKKTTKKAPAKKRAAKSVEKKAEAPVEKDFTTATHLLPQHREQLLRYYYERNDAEKDMRISEQDVKNQRLELRLMEEVNLRNAEGQLEKKSTAYNAMNEKVNTFQKELCSIYGIKGDIRVVPASGKIVR